MLPEAVEPGKVRGFRQTKFKSAPNKIGLQPAPVLDFGFGVDHLTGQQWIPILLSAARSSSASVMAVALAGAQQAQLQVFGLRDSEVYFDKDGIDGVASSIRSTAMCTFTEAVGPLKLSARLTSGALYLP